LQKGSEWEMQFRIRSDLPDSIKVSPEEIQILVPFKDEILSGLTFGSRDDRVKGNFSWGEKENESSTICEGVHHQAG